eukprot:1002941-Pelagomonas_calceolata.AAC.2
MVLRDAWSRAWKCSWLACYPSTSWFAVVWAKGFCAQIPTNVPALLLGAAASSEGAQLACIGGASFIASQANGYLITCSSATLSLGSSALNCLHVHACTILQAFERPSGSGTQREAVGTHQQGQGESGRAGAGEQVSGFISGRGHRASGVQEERTACPSFEMCCCPTSRRRLLAWFLPMTSTSQPDHRAGPAKATCQRSMLCSEEGVLHVPPTCVRAPLIVKSVDWEGGAHEALEGLDAGEGASIQGAPRGGVCAGILSPEIMQGNGQFCGGRGLGFCMTCRKAWLETLMALCCDLRPQFQAVQEGWHQWVLARLCRAATQVLIDTRGCFPGHRCFECFPQVRPCLKPLGLIVCRCLLGAPLPTNEGSLFRNAFLVHNGTDFSCASKAGCVCFYHRPCSCPKKGMDRLFRRFASFTGEQARRMALKRAEELFVANPKPKKHVRGKL